jgi:hypothetical protein
MPAVSRARALLLLLGGLAASGLDAQQPVAAAPPETARPNEPFRIRLGPFRLYPYIRIGEVAVDTNVYYTQDARTTDLVASGGPGLRLTLPLGRFELYGDGNVDYYWFLHTVQERRFGGQAGGGLIWETSRHALTASRFFIRDYRRPTREVDRRVEQDRWRDEAVLLLGLGRVDLLPAYYGERSEVPQGTFYLGTDLGTTLTQDVKQAVLELDWHLTGKTSFVMFGDQEWRRFEGDPTRDSDSNRAAAGFQVLSQTRLSGRAVGGVRFIRPLDPRAGGELQKPFVDTDLDWILGAKTRLSAAYRYDTQYSAFDSVSGRLPITAVQDARLEFQRFLGRRFDIRLDGGLTAFENGVPVVVADENGRQLVKRDDLFYNAGIDLGFHWGKLRIGAMARYDERQSNYDYFGVDGLIVGARIGFNPGSIGAVGGRQLSGRRPGASHPGRY